MTDEIGVYNIVSTVRVRGIKKDVEEVAQLTADRIMKAASMEASFYGSTLKERADEFEFIGVTVEKVFLNKGYEGV